MRHCYSTSKRMYGKNVPHSAKSRTSYSMMYAVSLFCVSASHHFPDLQKEPEGVMTVKFRDPLSAQACVIVSAIPNHSFSLCVDASMYRK